MVVRRGRPLFDFQQEEYLRQLFEKLDKNSDGVICSSDLMRVLELRNCNEKSSSTRIIQKFLLGCGAGEHDTVSFQQFVDYVLEHDKKLVIAFDALDKAGKGYITPDDIKVAFKSLGLTLGDDEANRLFRRVGKSGQLKMDFGDWRQFLLFHPADNVPNIFEYWRHDTFADTSGDAAIGIPEEVELRGGFHEKQMLQLVAGAIAGAVSRTCTAPIDRLKLMRQVYGYKHKGSGFTEAYRYMLREGGAQSLWRGNGINVLKIAPETALKYGTYEHYKRFLTSPDSAPAFLLDASYDHPLLTQFLAGSMAGSTAQTVIYPLEVLKTRMCLRKTGQFHSIWHCANVIYQQHGFLAFYRGYFVNLIGIIPYAGIELGLYEMFKATYTSRFLHSNNSSDRAEHLPAYVIPLLASVSSACGIIATYPASLVRAKLQATYWSQTEHQKITAINLIRVIWKDDSIVGLYRGMLTNLTKVLPAVSISMASYEALRHRFNLGPLGSG